MENNNQLQPANMRPEDIKLVEYLLNTVSIAKGIRNPWEWWWHRIMRHVNPFDTNADTSSNVAGSVYDQPTTGRGGGKYTSALESLVRNAATILNSQLIDPSVKWFSLTINKPILKWINDNPAVQKWRRDLEDYIYWICSRPESNFYTSTRSFIWEWFTLGTACRYLTTDRKGELIFDSVPMMKVAYTVNAYGSINFVAREMQFTLAQAIELWGDAAIVGRNTDPLSLQTQKKKYWHIVMENQWMMHPNDFPYVGFVIDEANRAIMSREFYYSMPYIISRYFHNSGDLYGTSSLWQLLDEIEYMDHITQMSRYAAEYAIMPPLKVSSDLTIPKSGMMPGIQVIGGIDALGNSAIEPLMMGGGINISNQIFEMKRADVKHGLIIEDMFVPDDPHRTATEVNEMRVQQDNKIKSIITAWEREDISKTIRFVLRHIINEVPFPYLEAGIDPADMPDPLEYLEPKYTGVLGRQQERYDAAIITQILQDAAALSQMPEIVNEIYNLDEILRFKAKAYDLPNNFLRTEEETNAIREQKAQAQAQAMQQAEAQNNLEAGLKMNMLLKDQRGA